MTSLLQPGLAPGHPSGALGDIWGHPQHWPRGPEQDKEGGPGQAGQLRDDDVGNPLIPGGWSPGGAGAARLFLGSRCGPRCAQGYPCPRGLLAPKASCEQGGRGRCHDQKKDELMEAGAQGEPGHSWGHCGSQQPLQGLKAFPQAGPAGKSLCLSCRNSFLWFWFSDSVLINF